MRKNSRPVWCSQGRRQRFSSTHAPPCREAWFHPAFETELIEAARYLEKQRSDFGRQFVDDVEAAIERIMQTPETWRVWRGNVRRFLLPRFRYTIRYRVRRDENRVDFLSVIHTARHPDAGTDR